MNKEMTVNGKSYTIIKLLGKGKGGYSYLAESGNNRYVLKQIHHEPCDYYQFGNKLEAEIRDYKKLKEIGIKMPDMLEIDVKMNAASCLCFGWNVRCCFNSMLIKWKI